MGDNYRYSDSCRDDHDFRSCDSFDPCCDCDKEESDDLWSWLPIIIIVFILCGGLGWFGGGGRGDSCGISSCGGGSEGGGMSWLLIIIVIILLLNPGDGKKGGFLGGLFG